MDAIALMKEEHQHILRLLKVVRKHCISIVNGSPVAYEDFEKMIDFVQNYADRHHHQKEELILFKEMSDTLGERMAQGPIMGMLVEHDMARLFIQNLKTALSTVKQGDLNARVDIIGNAIAYADLLQRHIDKEDKVIYTFAEKNLSSTSLAQVNQNCVAREQEAQSKNIPAHYLKVLQSLEEASPSI